jgi:hypothetical protein
MLKRKEKLRKGDNTTSMDYGNGDVAVGQQSTHATHAASSTSQPINGELKQRAPAPLGICLTATDSHL